MATDQDAQPTGQVLVDTYTGVTLVVTPLTLTARQLILQAVQQQWPMPDKTLYERVSDMPELGSDEPAKIPAESNPGYIAAVEIIESARAKALQEAVLNVAVSHPSQDELIRHHLPTLRKLRDLSDDVYEADWPALIQMVLASEVELMQVFAAVNRRLALTEAEIINGMRYFRLSVSETTI